MFTERRASLRLAATLALLCALAACAGAPLKAVSDFDRQYDFSAVQSFAILPIDRTSAAERLISDMQVGRINDALTTELRRRGFTVEGNAEDADLLLSWHLVTRERTDIRAYNTATAYNCWRCGPPVNDVSVRQYTEGTFIVDLIDPLKNQSVWRSTIQSEIRAQPDPERTADNRRIAAQAVLEPFPPQAADR
jgi:hypothetical protein